MKTLERFLVSKARSTARHPNRPLSRFALTEERHARQVKCGMYLMERGEPVAIPSDKLNEPGVFLSRSLWKRDKLGRVFRPGTQFTNGNTNWQNRTLAYLRDHVHRDIPAMYYKAVLGHDIHITTWGDLYAKHWHANWANPFDPGKIDYALDPSFNTLVETHNDIVHHDSNGNIVECRLGDNCPGPYLDVVVPILQKMPGFIEELGWLSGAKVTTAFVSEEIDELVATASTEYADFDFHAVGINAVAEDNTHTALQTDSGITRDTGTPTDSDPIYQNVGTMTADATESWEEHGLFNNVTGVAMMDRSLTGGQSVNSSDQVQYTYQLTKNAEA